MPTYEYICKQCGHLFEIVQSMRDDPLTECPECGGVLRKVFAPPAISFKGSGFYATDHGKKSKKPSDKTGAKGEKSDAKAGSSTDSSTTKSSASPDAAKDGGSGSSSTKEGSTGPKEKSPS